MVLDEIDPAIRANFESKGWLSLLEIDHPPSIAFETLNCKRKIWTERAVILDEIDLAIRANFESRGWLSLLEIDHPPRSP